jgi:hypothetical protein
MGFDFQLLSHQSHPARKDGKPYCSVACLPSRYGKQKPDLK